MISSRFPDELRQFYLKIGYGYLGYDDPDFRNQIMHPLEIAKLRLGLDFYGNMFTVVNLRETHQKDEKQSKRL